jgi:hypothetical protein
LLACLPRDIIEISEAIIVNIKIFITEISRTFFAFAALAAQFYAFIESREIFHVPSYFGNNKVI